MSAHYRDLGNGCVAVSDEYLRNLIPSLRELTFACIWSMGVGLAVANVVMYALFANRLSLIMGSLGFVLSTLFVPWHRLFEGRMEFLKNAKREDQQERYWEHATETPFD